MKYKCLFVDDDKSVCESFKRLMPEFGIAVDVAHDSESALKLLGNNYDLVCLDWNLKPGTTRPVADILARRNPLPLVVIHSSDEDGSIELIKTLKGQCMHIRKTDLVTNINRVMVELNSRPVCS